MAEVRFGRWRMPLPRSRGLRVALGGALVVGGLLGFLPVLGFWMLPLGVVVLSADSPAMRRLRRRAEVRFGRRWPFSRRGANGSRSEEGGGPARSR